ncbi:unnamed protein product [Arctogadus glacialis]
MANSAGRSDDHKMFKKKVHCLKFSVVHFLEENEVDVAPSLWLAKSNGVLNCYWPANNASVLVRRCALPDKVLWKKYKVRVFSTTDSYSLARERARKGQDNLSGGNGGDKFEEDKRSCQGLRSLHHLSSHLSGSMMKAWLVYQLLESNHIILVHVNPPPSGEKPMRPFKGTIKMERIQSPKVSLKKSSLPIDYYND